MNPRTAAALSIPATLLLAAGMRFVRIDLRPMHADEAILAEITATVRATRDWKYDASDYHGIVLPALGAAIPADLTERTLRMVPAVAGVALALLVLAANSSLPAGLLIACSPAMVYWSRFYIPEMILALLTAAWLTVIRSPGLRLWRPAGILAAAMLATKETALLSVAAAAAAWLIAGLPRPGVRRVFFMIAIAAIGAAAALTSGFRLWDQLARLPGELMSRAAGAGHLHPFWWHFSVLRWELLAIPLAAWNWKRDRFLAAYAMVLALLYCAIPYKTPWCAVQFWWPILTLAGYRARPAYALCVLFAGVALWTSFHDPASPDNPYVYAQTLPEALELPRRISRLAAPGDAVQVFSRRNLWPLPWYLRDVKQQWRRGVDFAARPAPLIVVTPELEPDLIRWLYEAQPPGERELYMNALPNPVFLRPGLEVRLYCAKRLWDTTR